MAKPTGRVIQCPEAFATVAPAGSLHALTGTYLEAQHKLAEIDLDPQTIADTLEALEGDIAVKALRVIAIAQQYDAFAAGIEARLSSMAKRMVQSRAQAERLREYVLESARAAGLVAGDRIVSPEIELRFQRNPAKLEVTDATLVPSFFFRDYVPPPVPDPRDPALIDKNAIKAYLTAELKEGEAPHHVAGVTLTVETRLVEK